MRFDCFRRFLRERKCTDETIESAILTVKDLEQHLNSKGKSIAFSTESDLKKYLTLLVSNGLNTPERLRALARYVYFVKRNDLYQLLAAVLGGRGVYQSIGDNVEAIAGKQKRDVILNGFVEPPLGSLPDMYPKYTEDLMDRLLSSLSFEEVKLVLAGNHHRIPLDEFTQLKKRFERAPTIDAFLVQEHNRLVTELEDAMQSGRIWYEQEITPEVIDFVRGDQTIQTGVRDGDKILKSKIPFNPSRWLKEKDLKMRRFYACHCPLARTAILSEAPEIPEIFCYCSGGYEKLPWDVIFGTPVEIEVLESVLGGSSRCRFAITLPKVHLK